MRRKPNPTPKLYSLAERLKDLGPLYITGGYVRNSLMGIKTDDIDIAAAIPPERIIERLIGSDYKVTPVNLRLGTLKIECTDEYYEYTAFRSDSYPLSSGVHKPSEVEFVSDIATDFRRRDFTVNALYYDILNEEIIDIGGGIADMDNRILRAVDDPMRVFSEDGLRIMRMARFAAELDYSVDEATLAGARNNSKLLQDIAPERIVIEWNKLLDSDLKYGLNGGAPVRGMEILKSVGALDILFSDIIFNYFGNLLKTVGKLRLASLIVNFDNSAETLGKRLRALKFKNEVIKYILALKAMFTVKIKLERTAAEFIADYPDEAADLARLLEISDRMNESDILYGLLAKAAKEELPDRVSALKIRGADLIELGVPEAARAGLLRELIIVSLLKGLNERNGQLTALREDTGWKG
jgi:tRNA nucleotidyltransferase/poly(A) polymerase